MSLFYNNGLFHYKPVTFSKLETHELGMCTVSVDQDEMLLKYFTWAKARENRGS